MTRNRIRELSSLEGRRVGVALADGRRIDDCQLVSAGRGRAETVWVFANGADVFISLGRIVDLWEAA